MDIERNGEFASFFQEEYMIGRYNTIKIEPSNMPRPS